MKTGIIQTSCRYRGIERRYVGCRGQQNQTFKGYSSNKGHFPWSAKEVNSSCQSWQTLTGRSDSTRAQVNIPTESRMTEEVFMGLIVGAIGTRPPVPATSNICYWLQWIGHLALFIVLVCNKKISEKPKDFLSQVCVNWSSGTCVWWR